MAQQAIDLTTRDETLLPLSRVAPTLGMRGGLGKTLLIAFLLLAIVPLSLLAILIYNRIQYDARQKLLASLNTMVVLQEAHLVDWAEGYERELGLLANTPDLEVNLSTLLTRIPDTAHALTGLVLLDRNTGEILAAYGTVETELQILGPLLALKEGLVITLPPGSTAPPVLAISHVGVEQQLVGLLSWDSLQWAVTTSDNRGEAFVTYVVTEDGLMISARGATWLSMADPEAVPEGVRQALQGRSDSGSYYNLDGAPVFGAYRWNPELRIALLAEELQIQSLAAGNALTALVVGATLVVALITTVIAAVVTRRITRPIVQLTETAAWMARGDLRQRVTIARQDEIGILARAFNRMAAELRLLYENLEAKVAERTRQLEEANERTSYYAMQLSLSAEVARVATSIRDVDVLLTTVARLIRDAFELHHVSIYLLENGGELAVWQADDHRSPALPERAAANGKTLIGRVIRDGQGRVVHCIAGEDDVPSRQESDGQGSRNSVETVSAAPGLSMSDLSLSASIACEMAAPLRVRERLLGVLDLQSSRANDFSDNDQMVYQSLADQISIAIENARAYAMERETVKRLQELDQIQSEFLSNMSHALRTPLNSIIGFSRIMLKELDGPLSELQRADLITVHDSGRQLLGLLNDMLELTQLDLGTAPFCLMKVDLAEIIEGVMTTTGALAQRKPIQLHTEMPAEMPMLNTDAQRIRQVILALLTNAVKYTEEGSIWLRVAVADGQVTISVEDTGMGIPPEERERIFADAIHRGAAGEGSVPGFGLAISRRVIERLGGRIWVEGRERGGSTLTFTLPISPTEA